MASHKNVIWLKEISINDIARVGGKNASLGEMLNQLSHVGIQVPDGFATTAEAFHRFLAQNNLDQRIHEAINSTSVEDVTVLAKTGAQIRQWIMETPLLPDMEADVKKAFQALEKQTKGELAVAVRSSATAEDLPEASFAGQQETLLNVRGLEEVLKAIRQVFASLFNDRAIAYRAHHGFTDIPIALSAGVQQMVRSDVGASGVAFTIDTESGFKDVVFITSAYGLGETVVQGAVNPDEFYVYKPALAAKRFAILQRHLGSKAIKMIYAGKDSESHELTQTVAVSEEDRQLFSLNDAEIESLARQAVIIEKHYGRPMDIEWAKDGNDGKIYILQARPETVKSREQQNSLERYEIKRSSKIVTQGRSIGQKIGQGKAKVIKHPSEMDQVQAGDVLVTDMTDPDWETIMKRAAAIVTNRGGRTCHAAIIARELGIPAIVGCGNATQVIQPDVEITVSCAEGDIGYVYEGILELDIKRIALNNMPKLPVKIMMNIGNPERALAFQSIPNEGVGLARLEFIINNMIGVHPKALLNFKDLPKDTKAAIEAKIAAYADPVNYYVERLREGISILAAAFHPKPIIVRLSDFKSNEYANLIGGELYEPHEENPMLGFRGASRYAAEEFRDCFELECRALKKVRDEMGLTNVQVMVPFVRTVEEAKQVVELLAKNGLARGKNDLKIIMMCEIPSNALLAEEFLEYFDGFSIGSNDLTQLTLGLDRDSAIVAKQFDERNDAVKALLKLAIQACKKANKYIGICGQGPSDHPDFAKWLIEQGIDSISLNPDSVMATYFYLLEGSEKSMCQESISED
jgi:pyruvate,water dikinase